MIDSNLNYNPPDLTSTIPAFLFFVGLCVRFVGSTSFPLRARRDTKTLRIIFSIPSCLRGESFCRQGAKTQTVISIFLCAFASLRECFARQAAKSPSMISPFPFTPSFLRGEKENRQTIHRSNRCCIFIETKSHGTSSFCKTHFRDGGPAGAGTE